MANTDSAPVAQAVHDLGAALWFGGSVFGVAGVNKSGADLTDPLDRVRVASSAWRRFAPVQWAGIAATALSGLRITDTNKTRLALQGGFGRAGATKAAFTAAGAVATAYAAYSGRKIAQATEEAVRLGEQVEVQDATLSTEKTPERIARWQKRQRVAQYLVPATSGAVVVLNSYLVQQYRPGPTTRGVLRKLVPGR